MSTLHEMASELARRIREYGEVEYFLVLQDKIQDPKTGVKPGVVVSNLPNGQVLDVTSRGVTGLAISKLQRGARHGRY